MSTAPDLTQLVALEPPGAGRVHLHLPGYRPGKKERSMDNAPLCGAFAHSGLPQVRLDVAQHWPHVKATWAGSGDGGMRHWCPLCLGRLVVLLGMQDELIRRALASARTSATDDLIEAHCRMVPGIPEGEMCEYHERATRPT